MPKSPLVEMTKEEQVRMLAALRCALRLPAGPPHLMVVYSCTHPDRHRRGPVLRALQRVPYSARLSGGNPGSGARHPGAPHSTPPRDRAAPRANPIERDFGDVHDLCTRNHTRERLRDLVADVEEHLHVSGPWQYKLSALDYEPAVETLAAEEHAKVAA